MLTAKDIKDKAERTYKDFLISVLRREMFFPFHIKGNKGNANLPLQTLYPALKHLIDNSKEKIGYGYSLTYKEVNTRHSGIITMPDAIFFENPVDYLKFIEKEADFLAFRRASDLTKRQVPSLLDWLENNVLTCQKYANEWADFLKITTFFLQNPNKKPCYWRQLPIDVDLNALEIHQPVIAELLNAVLPISAHLPTSDIYNPTSNPSVIRQNDTQFEPRFGLLFDEPMLRIRFLSENSIIPNIGNDIALPISTLANLTDITCKNIFFITDKNVFLSFPNYTDFNSSTAEIRHPQSEIEPLSISDVDSNVAEIHNPQSEIEPLSIAVLWEHNVEILSKIAWFSSKNCYFLSDLTIKGFEQLSEMRSILPKFTSFLMDKTTFDAFPQHHQTFKTAANASPFLIHLTPDEQAFYTFLFNLKEKNGLLQKNVAHTFLEKRWRDL